MYVQRHLKKVACLAAALSSAGAWALPPAIVTVTYTTGAQSVPFSPAALGLLALLVGVFALSKLRTKSSNALGLFLITGLIAATGVGYFAQSHAMIPNTTVSLSSGNPATQQGPLGLFSILNDTSMQVTITNVSVNNGYTVTTNCNGQSLSPTNSCSVTVTSNPG